MKTDKRMIDMILDRFRLLLIEVPPRYLFKTYDIFYTALDKARLINNRERPE